LSDAHSEDLLTRARSGDGRALEHLFARYLPRLYRLAHGRIPPWARNSIDTGDLVQDTMLKTYRHLGAFESQYEGALIGYLRHSLLNRIRTQFRHTSRHPSPVQLKEHHADTGASPLESIIGDEQRHRYAAALRRLKAPDRHAVVGRVELGYSYEQLALVLKKPTAEAARVAVRRALLRLGEEMKRV
jgi:RNA polymerase sigma-70 factor (ECF subfamily)